MVGQGPPGGGNEVDMMRTIPKRGVWLQTWFRVDGLGSADGFQALLTGSASRKRRWPVIRSLRWDADGTKLNQDLEQTEDPYAMYRQAGWLTSDATLRGKMDEFAAAEARGSRTNRAVLARVDSHVMDLP